MWNKIWHFFTRGKKNKNVKSDPFSSIHLIQTPVHNLSIGMYVSELDKPWLETSFPFQGFIIESESDIQALLNECHYVYIDVNKQKKRKTVNKKIKDDFIDKNLVISKAPERLGTFETEIDRAEDTYKETGILVNGFMEKIASGGGIDSKLAKEAVAACVNSILHSPDAFLWLSQLKSQDKYTAQHSLNVCVLSIVLGRHIGLTEKQLNNVGLCGMMHDMGKMLVPKEILNKPDRLEPEELEIMQSHTTLGYELLNSSDNMFFGAIETALTHHERMDGKGYPRQINSMGLSHYSNMVAIADIYDAITSDRVYQKGKTHHEATNIMLNVAGNHLDYPLVVKFIESLGAYPPGSFVELNNGVIALVVEESNRYRLRLRPKVLLILDKDKNPIEEQILDLSDMMSSHLSIKAIIRPSDYNIDSKIYYMKGVIQKGFVNK